MKRILYLIPLLLCAGSVAQRHTGSTAAPDGPFTEPPYISGNRGVQQSVQPAPAPQTLNRPLSTDQQQMLLRENDRIAALRRAAGTQTSSRTAAGGVAWPLTQDQQRQVDKEEDRAAEIRRQ